MKQNVQIHTIPTKKATGLYTTNYIQKRTDGSFVCKISSPEYTTIPYNLYVTTSETPKEGDWQINHLTNKVSVRTNSSLEISVVNCSKIVATDDKNLSAKYGSDGETYGKMKEGLPPISPEFQQAWVREANNGTPIINAMMEMEDCGTEDKGVIGIKEHQSTTEGGFYMGYRPKLNSQGFVTILPVKEKMYTKEEVIELCWKQWCIHGSAEYKDSFNKWISENL